MSREEVAIRAGMDASYLEYLETRPAQPGTGPLLRLAGALETTYLALSGGGVDIPPGQGKAAAHPCLAPLDPDACRRLLGDHGVGRIVFSAERGPVAMPVNYVVLDGDVVFRTDPERALAQVVGQRASFEVDQVDDALRAGWSVLVSGRVEAIEDERERARVEARGLEPWAGGARDLRLRVRAEEVTGRRIFTE